MTRDTVNTAEARLARLQQANAERWEIWTVRSHIGPTAWCVRPAGTAIGIHHEHDPARLQAWIDRVDALTASGITIAFHPGAPPTATATWTSPARIPASYGPAPVPDVLSHAEATTQASAAPTAPGPAPRT